MLDGVWPSSRPQKGDRSMFQPKARIVSVLALTAALSLLPLADASAARVRTARSTPKPSGFSLLVQLGAEVASFWDALQTIWSDAGVRMDDNG
jgi:hypothetical protein